ncbi:MAG: clostripain-related cysteine peptidase [Bacteroidetes bacterium]|nr:clostripain-related cysteine peptidase [Bacteroidota bacterium]
MVVYLADFDIWWFDEDYSLDFSTDSMKAKTSFSEIEFRDDTVKYGIPLLLRAKLQADQKCISAPYANQTVAFDIFQSGSWQPIPDDGISGSTFVTDANGIASVFFTAPPDLPEGDYPIRVSFAGNDKYDTCSLKRILRVHKPQWLILSYMCGDNDLETVIVNQFYNDIFSAGDNNDLSIIVLFDRSDGYDQSHNNWTGTRYYQVCKNNTAIYRSQGELNMGDPATVINFINTTITDCDANHFSIVFDDHGTGCVKNPSEEVKLKEFEQIADSPSSFSPALNEVTTSNEQEGNIGGICFDENPIDHLTPSEIRNVFTTFQGLFDEILYYACVMSTIENTYDLMNLASFVTSSEDVSMTEPSLYHEIKEEISDNTSPLEFTEIVTYSLDQQRTFASWNLSADNIGGLSDLISGLSSRLTDLLPEPGKRDMIADARNLATSFGAYTDWTGTYVDIEEFCLGLQSSLDDTIIDLYTGLIIDKINDPGFKIAFINNQYSGSLGGMSIYFPPDKTQHWEAYFQPGNLSFVSNPDQQWDDFLQAFYDTDDPVCSTICPVSSDWIRGDITVTSAAEDASSGVLYVEFQYSTDNSNWVPVASPGNPEGKDFIGSDGWGLVLRTAGCENGDTINTGLFRVRSKAADLTGHLSDWSECTNPFGIDNTPPAGSLAIALGDTATCNQEVELTAEAIDELSGVESMQLSNDGNNWSGWISFSSAVNWDLTGYGGNANPGLKTVYVRYRDHAGNESNSYTCTIRLLNVPEQPQPITGSTEICAGNDTHSYSVSTTDGASSYQWTLPQGVNGNSVTNSILINVTQMSGTFTLIVNAENQCGSSQVQSLTITVHPLPEVSAGPDQDIPAGSSATLIANVVNGEPPYSFSWSNGMNTQTVIVSPASTTSFFLTVTDNFGCSGTDAVTVNVLTGGSSSISGIVTYQNTVSTPMTNTRIFLCEGLAKIDSTQTNQNGSYSFSNLPTGTYNLKSRTNKPWWGGNSTDALLIMKHFTQLSVLYGLPLKAGDVDNSGFLNAADALLVMTRFTGLQNSFTAGDWAFENPSIPVINSTNYVQNIKALCYGDVNGSNIPSVKEQPDISLRKMGTIVCDASGRVDIPVRIRFGSVVAALSLVLEFPSDFLEVSEIIPSDKLKNSDHSVFLSHSTGMSLRVAWYDLNSVLFSPDETIFVIRARIKGDNYPEIFIGEESGFADNNGQVIYDAVLILPENIDNQDGFSMSCCSPNPVSDNPVLRVNLQTKGTLKIRVVNALSQETGVIRNETLEAGYQEISWDASGLKPGVYFIIGEFETGNTKTRKIQKLIKE